MLLAVLSTGCYEDFAPEIDTQPVLAINSLITAGQPIVAEVTHTWVYSEGWTNAVDYTVDDAVVSIYANDAVVDGDYLAREGDKIRIVAESKKYGSAWAEVAVPYAVAEPDLEYSATLVSDWRQNDNWAMNSDVRFNVDISLSLSDNPATADYYKLSYGTFVNINFGTDGAFIDSPVDFYPGTFDEKIEPIFSEHISVFESMMGSDAYRFTYFTDRQFSGKSYTLHLRFTDARYNVRNPVYDESLLDCGYVLELQTISPSLYNWANYMWQTDNGVTGDIIDLGFGDPIWGYSNVSTGAGVVAARATSSVRVNLKDFLKSIVVRP